MKLALTFATAFKELASSVHTDNAERGFWEEKINRNQAEMIALMHSELSEALEGIRHNDPPDEHCPEFSSVEVELADVVIRILDYSGGFRLDVGAALEAKLRYNRTRPYKHGKKF